MGLSDLVQKAVYLGIGVAAYAGEKAGTKLNELPAQLQKLADEFVDRGEMTAEEAKRFVDDLIQKAQKEADTQQSSTPSSSTPPSTTSPTPPRRIEIDDATSKAPEPEAPPTTPPTTKASTDSVTNMRRQIDDLQAELRRLRKD